jgi:hypothetical protein
MLTNLAGDSAMLVALGLGVVAGWVLVPVVGGLVILVAHLLGLVIGLALIALVLGLVYGVIGSLAGWPPFD